MNIFSILIIFSITIKAQTNTHSVVSNVTFKVITWTYTGGAAEGFKIMMTANEEQPGGDNCEQVTYDGGPDGGKYKRIGRSINSL